MAVDVVICARNEESTISGVITAFQACANCGSIIVVDDGSTDNTYHVASYTGAYVVSGPGTGKGQAMMTGLCSVATNRVAFCDGDLTGWKPEHAALLVNPCDGETIVRLDTMLSYGLSGQRSLPVCVLNDVRLFGWAAETQINEAVDQWGIPVYLETVYGVRSKPRAGKARGIHVARDRFRAAWQELRRPNKKGISHEHTEPSS